MKRLKKVNKKTTGLASVIAIILLVIVTTYQSEIIGFFNNLLPPSLAQPVHSNYTIENLPEYDGKNYVVLNDDEPTFTDEEKTRESFEEYSDLDIYGRCGVAYANVSKETMPTTERGNIGNIRPSGWVVAKYDIVDGKYLYNRCHLIGYQLTGENSNEKNLITCTRQMNTVGMLQFENKVAKYVKNTRNHVLYRVTPVYDGDNLVAKGVQMEAYSVEDKGRGVKFNVFVYNVQDGIDIDYKTGESKLSEN